MSAAVYTDSPIPEYAGNPLIEALPSMLRADSALVQAMAVMPAFNCAERELPALQRRELVSRIHSLFIPLPSHFELFERLATCIRRSYTWRNPLDPQVQAYLHRTGEVGLSADTLSARSAAGAQIFLKGISGVGKTTGIEACLRGMGPSVLRHASYRGKPLLETQIVWLKVSCPEDRSLKSLCAAIVVAADTALGTERYTAMYLDDARVTTGRLVRAVMQILANNHVGVLVVDELQNLFASRGQPSIELLNFLLRLRDDSGICLVLCGTYASLHLLQEKFRLARRVAAGVVDMRRAASAEDLEWCSFCEILWRYQWVREPRPYSPAVSQAFFAITQGIRGLAVPLFALAQEEAIRSGKETIGEGALRAAWRSHFSQLESAVAALRLGDSNALAKWDDLCDTFILTDLYDTAGSSVAGSSAIRRSMRRSRQVDPELAKLSQKDGISALRAAGVMGLPAWGT